MPDFTQKATLLLESSHDCHRSRVIGLKEGWVKDLPSTGQVITHSLVDSSIGTSAQGFCFEELHCLVSKLSLGCGCIVLIPELDVVHIVSSSTV